MIVSQADARAIVARWFPGHTVKLTTACTIIQPPLFEVQLGKPMIAVRKLIKGPASAVYVGRMDMQGRIDWTWDGTS